MAIVVAVAVPAGAAGVGSKLSWKDGTARLIEYVRSDPAVRPSTDPTMRSDSADVEVCSRTKGYRVGSKLGPFSSHVWQFHVETNDGRRYSGNNGRTPSLIAELGKGDCIRGWVTFSVPVNVMPRALLYAGGNLFSTATVARWKIP